MLKESDTATVHANSLLRKPLALMASLNDALETAPIVSVRGRVKEVLGTVVRATALSARIGEMCVLHTPGEAFRLEAEVIGFSEGDALLAPVGDMRGVSSSTIVTPGGHTHKVGVGMGLMGRVVDGFGRPLDDGELLTAGPVFAPEKMTFNFKKLDVVANAKNMFSARNLIEALKSVLKVVALTGIVWKLVHDNLGTLMLLAGSGIQPVTAGFALLIKSLLLATAFVFTVIAGFDMLIQRKLFTRQQMMTKDEVKREHKESDGAPEIKGERRKLHREIVQGGGGKRKPSVVVTNPTHLAVALLYEHGETPLPVVLAKGAGLQAQTIMREARAEGIPIIQHIPLARALVAQVEVDEPVPEHLFELVIDVLKAVKEIAPAERARS